MVTIVVLALVALFLGLRLYSVLGERSGHEQSIAPVVEREAAPATPLPATATTPARPGEAEADGLAYLPTAGPGVRALLASDPSFDVARFIEGAKSAYAMILEHYWAGKIDEVADLVDGHVLDAFREASAERARAGLTLDNRLVRIEQAVIAEAEVDKREALLTVRFDADITAVTRGSDGQVVAGSMSDAVTTRDRWTFRRDIAAASPDWLLVETDEE